MKSDLPNKISIVMRSYNEAWALRDTLDGVFHQDYSGDIELIVIDSGSTDGSHELIQAVNPAHFIVIEPDTYVPGRVLNQGLRLATCDWVVLLNSDATPANREWLPELLHTSLGLERPGSVFSRQIPRPDCKPVYAHDYDRCFGEHRESSSWEHFFSLVSCIVPRAVWEQNPFREDLQFAEDDEWSRRLKKKRLPDSICQYIDGHSFAQLLPRSGQSPCER
ncbi:MAG: glycosyltransferase [Verrucomicrobia bacterium]|nr:glycosyltransferase [Verrucomicrobiota bacterium]